MLTDVLLSSARLANGNQVLDYMVFDQRTTCRDAGSVINHLGFWVDMRALLSVI